MTNIRERKGPYADVAVVGAGAAGSIAAIRASQLGCGVVLIERNDRIGKKIAITGKGRCNITNTASIDPFIKKFGRKGEFLRTALFRFSSDDLIDFFGTRGLELKTERQGRVFPATDKAGSIISVLERCIEKEKIDILYGTRILEIECKESHFNLFSEDGSCIKSKKVVIATGGASYKETGSTGDGFRIAERLGHTIETLNPALVPLKTKEPWVKDLQGLALENIRITFYFGKKKLTTNVGEMIFTHFGISGPLVLDHSAEVVSFLQKEKEVKTTIDLKPGLKREQIESKLVHKFSIKGKSRAKNLLEDISPRRLISVLLMLSNLPGEKPANQITREERYGLIDILKSFPVTVTGSLPLEEAMVTNGGVATKEIDPRTMESRIVPGLYFAGEVIDGAAPSGGYNLQQAFSTGYLAGENAATLLLNR